MNYTKELLYGIRPVRRTNPKPGQSEYYYMDPRYENATNGENEIDVPSATSPNPYAKEIQKHLYTYNRELHDELFDNTQPQSINTPSSTVVSDDEIIARNIPEIKKWEGFTDYPYRDTKGNFTVGTGININNPGIYDSLNWVHLDTNQKGTLDEIRADRRSLGERSWGQDYGAPTFKNATKLRLKEEDIDRLTKNLLQEKLTHIRKYTPNFNQYPAPIQDALIDITYNHGNIVDFPYCRKYIEEKNLEQAVKECHRKGIQESRNKEIERRLRSVPSYWNN